MALNSRGLVEFVLKGTIATLRNPGESDIDGVLCTSSQTHTRTGADMTRFLCGKLHERPLRFDIPQDHRIEAGC